jgi:PPK2 family polyphosphate:nucleotide phosphotransferase
MPNLEKMAEKIHEMIRVRPGKKVRLKDFDPGWAGDEEVPKKERKEQAGSLLSQDVAVLARAQDMLYADDKWALLVVLQGMDAAGKDGIIKHVMSGLNPQGCQVFSFKKPSAEELDHNFLWRYMRCLPERGRIGIFNRSYYEEVLVVRVHTEFVVAQKLPGNPKPNKAFWEERYEDINHLEQHLVRNGILVLKFFLHLSKKEQRKRLLARIDDPCKNWKLSPDDIAERGFWDQYIEAFEGALSATSTEWAPWYIIPSDRKWVARALVANILARSVEKLGLSYPEVTPEHRRQLDEIRKQLENEDE